MGAVKNANPLKKLGKDGKLGKITGPNREITGKSRVGGAGCTPWLRHKN
jgi:hypothetical protein